MNRLSSPPDDNAGIKPSREAPQPVQLTNPDGPALVVALCNQKGGVGKTTCTCHLARSLSLLTLRVLVIDLDPQGNATSALARDELSEETPGVAHAIEPDPEYTLREILVPSIWDNVTLAPTPSTEALSDAEARIEGQRFGRESALAEALRPALGDFDAVLIDNTPALGRLLINALTAATLALIVTEPEQWSADGLARLHRTIDLVTEHHNKALRTAGPMINRHRGTEHHRRIIDDEITPHYGQQAWSAPEDVLPMRTAIGDYLLAGQGLDQGTTREQKIAQKFDRFAHRLLSAGGRTI